MRRILLSISILLLLFAGMLTSLGSTRNLTSFSLRSISPDSISGDSRLGIDCGLGTTLAETNATGFPLAQSEVNPSAAALQTSCTWIGDAGMSTTGTNDGTPEPLVTDQDESLSLTSPAIGGGFTANVVLIQNNTASVNGFDLQVTWNPSILHAVELDQSGLSWKPAVLVTPVQKIDNVHGVAELAQVVQSPFGGNLTLFRIRFDIVGVGFTPLHLINVGGGLASPDFVVHQTIDGSFDSETYFDVGHSLNWLGSFTYSPNPPIPGSPLGFNANVTCGGCTGPLFYSWDFNSTSSMPLIAEATGSSVIITSPPVPVNRVTLNVTDAASHTLTVTQRLPLTVAVITQPSIGLHATTQVKALWLGGTSPYTGTWRLCPGTLIIKTVCTNPAPSFSSTTATSNSQSVIYSLAGTYSDSLSVQDTPGLGLSPTASQSSSQIDVTGTPTAFNVLLTASGGPGTFNFAASISYNNTYPTSFRSSQFDYKFNFGDGVIQDVTGTTSASVSHTYQFNSTVSVTVNVQEMSPQSTSKIIETGQTTVSVSSGLQYSFTLSPPTADVTAGQATSSAISVFLIKGTPQTINLTAKYSIPGATVMFNPASGTLNFTSTMSITTSPSTPLGSYPIIVQTAPANGTILNTTFILTVGAPSGGEPIIGVFSSQYGTANIVDTSLVAGSTFHVQVNVTNAPAAWNGYEFALYYDQRYLNVSSYNVQTNTVFSFPVVSPGTFNGPGALRVSVVNEGVVNARSGALADVTFTVIKSGGVSPLVLAAGMNNPGADSGAPPALCPHCPADAPNWSRLLAGATTIGVQTEDGYFKNEATILGPVASFTYSPSSPGAGQLITFNATNSFDPGNPGASNHGIALYIWDFGETTYDGNITTSTPVISHIFAMGYFTLNGNFSIRLTVIATDNGFEGMMTTRLDISAGPTDEPPIASFTFYPQTPVVGQFVSFSGDNSTDPDGSITDWFWNFGDGYVATQGVPYAGHLYNSSGNYTVILTVTDSAGLTASETQFVHVVPRPAHDVAIEYLDFNSNRAVAGEQVSFEVGVVNTGSNSSTFSVVVYYNNSIAAQLTGLTLQISGQGAGYSLTWDTSGVRPGNYTISATAVLPGDPTPGDNTIIGGEITILPSPVITLTPTSGPVGTKVTIRGTGFINPYNYPSFSEIDVTFDNQLEGFTIINSQNLTFAISFTFNVPIAQSGVHQVHVVDLGAFIDVEAPFTVTNPTGTLGLNVSVGTVYFPGDTATLFIAASQNGSLVSVTSLQIVLIKPNNTNQTLKVTAVTTGVYKTSYLIPTNATIGTYSILVQAHLTGSQNSSAITTFEVKLSWLSSQGKNIATAGIAITGLVGVATLGLWQKGYFKKKEEENTGPTGNSHSGNATEEQSGHRSSEK